MHLPSPRALVIVMFSTVVSTACAASIGPRAPVVTPAGVRFALVFPDARSVALAGTFNQWSSSTHPLARERSGIWQLMVSLPPGEHLFMYVVDGTRWVTPPLAEDFVDDGFGSKNGVVVVRPSER
jgi:1,4-alpha-glucan branching enzyme